MNSATLRNKGSLRSSRRSLETFYDPNLKLARDYQFIGYNAGYADETGRDTFDHHQQALVWRLLGDVPIGADSTVLDVGSGIGGPSTWIFERFAPARLIGVEFCGTSVRVAHDRWAGRARRPVYVQGDAHHLPVPDGSVDVIFNLESALHYADKRAFLRESRRVLKPGGMLCLGDFCTPYKRLFAALGRLDFLKTQFTTYARLWSSADYVAAFAAEGLELLRHEDVSRQASNSLQDGLREIAKKGWRAARGYRGRFYYLWAVEKMLRRRWLVYDLFAVQRVS